MSYENLQAIRGHTRSRSNGSSSSNSSRSSSSSRNGNTLAVCEWPSWLVVCLLLAQALSLLAVILVLSWMSNHDEGFGWTPEKIFNFHPVFMIIGFVVLCAEGLILHRAARSIRTGNAKLLHSSLQAAALGFGIAGLKAVFDSRNLLQPPLSNMYSLHSWLGITCTVLFCLQWAAGCVHFLLPHTPRRHRQLYQPVHRYCGLATFVLATATAVTGIVQSNAAAAAAAVLRQSMQEAASRMPATGISNILGIVLCALCVLVVCIVLHDGFQRSDPPSPPDEETSLQAQETRDLHQR